MVAPTMGTSSPKTNAFVSSSTPVSEDSAPGAGPSTVTVTDSESRPPWPSIATNVISKPANLVLVRPECEQTSDRVHGGVLRQR